MSNDAALLELLSELHGRGWGVTIQLHGDEDQAEVLIWNGKVTPYARGSAPTLLAALGEAAQAAMRTEVQP